MIEGLNKDTLERLYIKEGKSTYTIAKMFGCSPMTVFVRCRKYGISLRPAHSKIKGLNKKILNRLYVIEQKTTNEISEIFRCSPTTIKKRCRKYGISLRSPTKAREIKGLNKKILDRLYVKEQRTIREIAKMFGCSDFGILYRCKKYGIKLRSKGKKRIKLDKSVLHRLCVKEGKSAKEVTVAEIGVKSFPLTIHLVHSRQSTDYLILDIKSIGQMVKTTIRKVLFFTHYRFFYHWMLIASLI